MSGKIPPEHAKLIKMSFYTVHLAGFIRYVEKALKKSRAANGTTHEVWAIPEPSQSLSGLLFNIHSNILDSYGYCFNEIHALIKQHGGTRLRYSQSTPIMYTVKIPAIRLQTKAAEPTRTRTDALDLNSLRKLIQNLSGIEPECSILPAHSECLNEYLFAFTGTDPNH